MNAAESARLSAIEDGLRALVEPGSIFEVRALKVQRNGNGYAATWSGYFDDASAAARGIAELDGEARGIYATLNPTKPELLARAANRVREVRKDDPTTTDADIASRTRLLVDVDPVRPSGISTTEAEHKLARQRAKAIYDELARMGAPDPLVVDSGNGAQLVYAIDLPADDGGLVKRALAGLAFRFDDDAVRVDTGNYNPSRIVKIAGTLTRKGDATPERPHRRAALLSQPITLSPVPREILEAVAAWAPAPEKPTRTSTARTADFLDLASWLDRHGIEGRNPRTWRGGIIVNIACPMSADHGFDAWAGQDASGMLSAACFHASCSLKSWRELRDRFDPRPARRTNPPADTPEEPAYLREDADPGPATVERIEAGTPAPWDSPLDFSEPVRSAFPVEVLPEWIGAFVEGAARATQTPRDLAGCLALAAASASIARRFEIHPRPDWREPANIYSTTVLPPGHRKSAVFSLVQEPIIEAEREACGIAEPTVAEAETRHDHLAGRIKKLQGKAGDLSGIEADEAFREIARLKVELRAMRVPARPQYAVDDCTPEKLASLLAAQGERLAVFSAEGDLFEIIAGRYSSNGAPNLGVYLKAHSGDELRVDRVGRAAEYLHKPALTIGLAIQPDVLRTIQSKPGFRGRGLLGRFLYSLPLDALGSRDADPEPMPEDVRSTYARRLRALWALPTRYDERGEIIATPLTFSFDARDVIVGFLREIEPRLGGDGDLHPFTDWAGKLAGAVVRLAGVLHLADLAGKGDAPVCEIQAATVERGIVLGRYFLDHAIVAFRAMRADETADDAGDVLAWLRKQAAAGVSTFSKRDAHYARKHRFTKADDLDPALAFLESHGWIRPVAGTETRRPGRPASPRFEIHPRINR